MDSKERSTAVRIVILIFLFLGFILGIAQFKSESSYNPENIVYGFDENEIMETIFPKICLDSFYQTFENDSLIIFTARYITKDSIISIQEFKDYINYTEFNHNDLLKSNKNFKIENRLFYFDYRYDKKLKYFLVGKLNQQTNKLILPDKVESNQDSSFFPEKLPVSNTK